MVNGAHIIMSSKDAEADRAFHFGRCQWRLVNLCSAPCGSGLSPGRR